MCAGWGARGREDEFAKRTLRAEETACIALKCRTEHNGVVEGLRIHRNENVARSHGPYESLRPTEIDLNHRRV
jgi:hypothetical protein